MNPSPARHLQLERLAVAALAALAACEPGPPGPAAQASSPPADVQPATSAGEASSAPAAPATPPADSDAERTFAPLSRVTEVWGALTFSNRRARFAGFDGEMLLEYAGIMPAAAGEELAEARVYAITNSADYYARNTGRNAFCTEPPRWLTFRPRASDDGSTGDASVGLLTLDDWAAYRPDVAGYCGGGLYSSAAGGPTISTLSTK